MNEQIKTTGHVELQITDVRGKTVTLAGENLVTTAGQSLIAGLILGEAVDAPSYVACGSSNDPATKDQTALQGLSHERVAATVSRIANTITIQAEFGAGIADAVTVGEFGIFNASSAGTMFARWATVLFTLPPTSTVTITWRLTIGS